MAEHVADLLHIARGLAGGPRDVLAAPAQHLAQALGFGAGFVRRLAQIFRLAPHRFLDHLGARHQFLGQGGERFLLFAQGAAQRLHAARLARRQGFGQLLERVALLLHQAMHVV